MAQLEAQLQAVPETRDQETDMSLTETHAERRSAEKSAQTELVLADSPKEVRELRAQLEKLNNELVSAQQVNSSQSDHIKEMEEQKLAM